MHGNSNVAAHATATDAKPYHVAMLARPAPDSAHDADADLRLAGVSIGALQQVSFTVAAGRITALSGPSGSGKSRLLRAIADLDAHQGDIALGDVAQHSIPAHEWRRRVMLVPADSQWWAETIREHLPDAETPDWAALGFSSDTASWQVSRLSSGERQRLALLRAVAHGPHALLLDEPTANLDTDTSAQIETWLLALIRRHRWPTLWVSHDAAQIARVADHHLRIRGDHLEVVE